MTLDRRQSRIARLICALALLGVVSACTASDDENPDETPTSPTQSAGATSAPTRPPLALKTAAPTTEPGDDDPPPAATLDPASVQIISDGLCRATVPDAWVDDGTGRGTTPSGARFELFGNRIATDDDWQRAVGLIEAQAERRDGTAVSRGDAFIRLDFPGGAGFVYRGRFADRYCDIGVTARRGAVPDPERAVWDAIIERLEPAN